ncbi:MAG: hypothetical protein ACPL4H_02095 [Anaerolineales bacterium]
MLTIILSPQPGGLDAHGVNALGIYILRIHTPGSRAGGFFL